MDICKHLIIVLALVAATPSLARAQELEPVEEAPTAEVEAPATGETALYQTADLGLDVGLKLGGGFAQPFGPLGTGFVAELSVGYLLPFADRSFEVFLAGAYEGPGKKATISTPDARLPADGTWSYALNQRQAVITLGATYRLSVTPTLAPYASVGGRTYLTKTTITGDASGEAFGENQETATLWGGYFALGLDWQLGPGALLFEVQTGIASMNGTIIKNNGAGAINLIVGYRMFF